tara:strand:- start:181 stop:462 length:282 start_codon:yes stop_codon:yes gene_type:complete
MSNRRKLKKQIKEQTNLLIEDAFIESINGDKKESEKMDQVIDNLIDERFDLLSNVSDYPKGKDRKTVKAHFKSIKEDLAAKTTEYKKKIGRVG